MTRNYVFFLVVLSGMAALSWQVMWQIKASLALGVSAWGTAITLAVTMGGMALGSLVCGHLLRHRNIERPLRGYGVLEMLIGIFGIFLGAAFRLVESADTLVYVQTGHASPLVYVLGIAAAISPSAICMGATIPLLGLVSRQYGISLSVVYGLNTLGAAVGVMLAAFVLIPLFGVTQTCWIAAAVNFTVGILSWWPAKKAAPATVETEMQDSALQPAMPLASAIVLVTGFSTFVLEVAWFRSLKATFFSTTSAFAIMLAALLLALGLAGWLVPLFKKKKVNLGVLIALSGVLILLTTPVIERFHLFNLQQVSPLFMIPKWFVACFYVIGAPIFFLGIALPWVMGGEDKPRRWAVLYSLNTFAAIAGALSAAWIFLPNIGFARTSWLAGILVLGAGLLAAPRQKRVAWGGAGLAALAIAVFFESGIGRTTLQMTFQGGEGKLSKVLGFYEGPESTIAAIEYDNGGRALIVDGFLTASQLNEKKLSDLYMAWMGHLPMLMHPDPEHALVICFGTGQTSNAVRKENPKSLDIVDINPRVFMLAGHFDKNEGVLDDPRVNPVVMDGRAYMRRTDKTYDVITLEPMPPNFAGVNALYSKEFYELARKKLDEDGIIAQWVPFHLLRARYMASIVRTFSEVFPNAVLWMEPGTSTGILLGFKDEKATVKWPGFARNDIKRSYPSDVVRKSVLLNPRGVENYGGNGEVVTDDNQLLAYGPATVGPTPETLAEEMALLQKIAKEQENR